MRARKKQSLLQRKAYLGEREREREREREQNNEELEREIMGPKERTDVVTKTGEHRENSKIQKSLKAKVGKK